MLHWRFCLVEPNLYGGFAMTGAMTAGIASFSPVCRTPNACNATTQVDTFWHLLGPETQLKDGNLHRNSCMGRLR
jgi:hypothetical protein